MHLAWGEEPPALLVTGPGAAAPTGLAVVPAGVLADRAAVVPMAGRWEASGAGLRFLPRLAFARGTTYAVVRAEGGWTEVGRLLRADPDLPATTSVVAIHPSVEVVPENLLRVSVTFSAPMEEGSAAGRIRLVDPDGRDIVQALLPMPPELWDRSLRRLTLLLEPGRIKRGLVPNTALGAPLAERVACTVVVAAGVRDATGAPLVAEARRTFRVGPPVRARVDPERWAVTWPAQGSRDPLVVRFDRPLDHALALRCLRATDAAGREVPGHAAVDDGDARWALVPELPWPDPVALHVDAALEDLAGNSVRRVFDRDLRRGEDVPLDVDEVVLRSTP